MDSEVARSAWFYDLVAWLQLNRKRVLIGTVLALVVAVAASAMIYTGNQKEVNASEALSEIRAPMNPTNPPPPSLVEAYLKIARDYAGTKAAARALLVAGGTLYVQGNYAEAQKMFERVTREYPESPWLAEANYGIAATLDAQQKIPEATAKYEELQRRFPNQAVIDEAKLGLGRLYEVQNKPAQALKLYEELLRANPYGGIASEAGIRHTEIIEKHPELAMTNAPTTAPTLIPTPSNLPVKPSTNKPAINFTNLLKTPAANTPGAATTNAPLLIKPDAAAGKPQ